MRTSFLDVERYQKTINHVDARMGGVRLLRTRRYRLAAVRRFAVDVSFQGAK